MQRIFYILGVAILAAISLRIGLNFAADPIEPQRLDLKRDLDGIPPVARMPQDNTIDYSKWQQEILGKPGLWDALIPPPPPPPPPKPTPPPPPDLKKMLEGVKAARAQIGQKVKIITAQDARGSFVAIGEVVNGCTLSAFDRSQVTFSYFWKEGNKELTQSIPRE